MPATATSLKLPEDLKTRVEAGGEAAGKTPQAFMVEAIERETARAKRYERFIDEAPEAEREMERAGVHYAGDDPQLASGQVQAMQLAYTQISTLPSK